MREEERREEEEQVDTRGDPRRGVLYAANDRDSRTVKS